MTDGLDTERLFPVLLATAVLWFGVGGFWLENLKEQCRLEGRLFEFRLPLQQWMVLALGLSIQVGLLVKYATASGFGWMLFVFMPPLISWGLLEAIRPITRPAQEPKDPDWD
ncbi:MAG: hypothetical protein KIS92_05745 [Planctomycetota bacterium]|nr:hypothetical protein [Planctomycetota bacterium]